MFIADPSFLHFRQNLVFLALFAILTIFFCLFPFANTTTYIYMIYRTKVTRIFLLGVNLIKANPNCVKNLT